MNLETALLALVAIQGAMLGIMVFGPSLRAQQDSLGELQQITGELKFLREEVSALKIASETGAKNV
jgi:hypothetical protein